MICSSTSELGLTILRRCWCSCPCSASCRLVKMFQTRTVVSCVPDNSRPISTECDGPNPTVMPSNRFSDSRSSRRVPCFKRPVRWTRYKLVHYQGLMQQRWPSQSSFHRRGCELFATQSIRAVLPSKPEAIRVPSWLNATYGVIQASFSKLRASQNISGLESSHRLILGRSGYVWAK